MSDTKKRLKRLVVTYNLFSGAIGYCLLLIAVYAGSAVVINMGKSENIPMQSLMLYFVFNISCMALIAASWLAVKKSKLALVNLFNKVKPYSVGLIMISIMFFVNLTFWGAAAIGVGSFSYGIKFEQIDMFSVIYLLTTEGVLGFIALTLLSSISLSAFALGRMTKRSFYFADILSVIIAFIVSLTGYKVASIITFAVAAALSLANFIYTSLGRVEYEVL